MSDSNGVRANLLHPKTLHPKTLHLGVSIDGAGRHPAAWREPDARPSELFDANHFVELGRLAERGLLDFVTLQDSFRLQPPGQVRGHLDALLTMARIAPVTTSIGLVPTVTTTHTEPFHVSKNIATLDLVSGGRAGWLVDVSATEQEAIHFGRREAAPVDELYAEAEEAIEVVGRLWDSWEDDAVIRDVSTGRYIDRAKLHYTDFAGRFFSVRGPSITPRSPQGQSVVMVDAVNAQALAVATRRADVIFVHPGDVDHARSIREEIEAGLRSAGRDAAAVTVLAVIDVLLGDTQQAAHASRDHLDALADPLPSALDFTGTSADLAALFAHWSEAAAIDGFMIRPTALPSTLRRVIDDVVPLLQRAGLFRTAYSGRTLRDHFGLARPANRYATSGGAR